MRTIATAAVSMCILIALLAQNRATMSSPVIRSTTEEVTVTTQFSQFNAEGEYRIGIGTEAGPVAGAKIQLLRNDNPVQKNMAQIQQGYTANWWNVDAIKASCYEFGKGELSGTEPLTLRIAVPRTDMKKLTRFFIFVSKKYGPDLWYLEDGAELTDQYW